MPRFLAQTTIKDAKKGIKKSPYYTMFLEQAKFLIKCNKMILFLTKTNLIKIWYKSQILRKLYGHINKNSKE